MQENFYNSEEETGRREKIKWTMRVKDKET
jgi:hypothetical protein